MLTSKLLLWLGNFVRGTRNGKQTWMAHVSQIPSLTVKLNQTEWVYVLFFLSSGFLNLPNKWCHSLPLVNVEMVSRNCVATMKHSVCDQNMNTKLKIASLVRLPNFNKFYLTWINAILSEMYLWIKFVDFILYLRRQQVALSAKRSLRAQKVMLKAPESLPFFLS